MDLHKNGMFINGVLRDCFEWLWLHTRILHSRSSLVVTDMSGEDGLSRWERMSIWVRRVCCLPEVSCRFLKRR